MESKTYVEEQFRGSFMFYSFCQWLKRWKWLACGIGGGITLLLLALFFLRAKETRYVARITPRMIPVDVVGLKDVEEVLTGQLAREEVRKNFVPPIRSWKISFGKTAKENSETLMELHLSVSGRGDADSIGRRLHELVFQGTYLGYAVTRARKEKEAEMAYLDALISKINERLSLPANERLTDLGSAVYRANETSLLWVEYNALVKRRESVKMEVARLQEEFQLGFDVFRVGADGASKKLALTLVGAWMIQLFVMFFLWLLQYSYSVSATAVRMQDQQKELQS